MVLSCARGCSSEENDSSSDTTFRIHAANVICVMRTDMQLMIVLEEK